MAVNVRPLHDRIILERLEEGEQQVGGIIIPDTAKEKPQQGKVIAVGNGKVRDDGSVTAKAKLVRQGKRVALVQVNVNQARRLVATGMFTYLLYKRSDTNG